MDQWWFHESDWKLFRSKIAGWQEAYMDRLNKEYIAILESDKEPSDKFWELEGRIKNDKKSVGVVVEMRRSRMERNLISLVLDNVITMDDLEGFSDDIKEIVEKYRNHYEEE